MRVFRGLTDGQDTLNPRGLTAVLGQCNKAEPLPPVLCRDVRSYVQRCVDRGKDINLASAINKDTITKGLRYSLATGNWGEQGTGASRERRACGLECHRSAPKPSVWLSLPSCCSIALPAS